MTRTQARQKLSALGMQFNYASPFSDQDREYWWYADGTDAMLDHTATITMIGGMALISDFSDIRQKRLEQKA